MHRAISSSSRLASATLKKTPKTHTAIFLLHDTNPAQSGLKRDSSCVPLSRIAVRLYNNTTLMSARRPSKGGGVGRLLEIFCCGFFFQDPVEETKQRIGTERFLATVWSRDNICRSLSAASLSVSDVVCWEKPRLQITHRHRPRAKVGGCGVRGVPAALISAGVHRRSLLSRRLPCFSG